MIFYNFILHENKHVNLLFCFSLYRHLFLDFDWSFSYESFSNFFVAGYTGSQVQSRLSNTVFAW